MSTCIAVLKREPEHVADAIPGRFSGTDVQVRDVLNRLGDPLFVTDASAHIHFANHAAEPLLRLKVCAVDGSGRLLLATRQASGELLAILSSMSEERPGAATARAIRIQRPADARPTLVVVSSLSDGPHRRVPPQRFLVQLIGRLCPRDLPRSALETLFGLTQREMDVVVEFVRHGSLLPVAAQLAISHQTVRAHMKHIFNKCEVNSQVELIATLQKLCLFCGRGSQERSMD